MKNNKEIGFNYLRETIKLREDIEVAFISLGERLLKIRTEELWKAGHESFEDFLIEAKISSGTASRLITVYQHFVLRFSLSPVKLAKIGWGDLYSISQIANTKDKVEEWIEKGQDLTSSDLRKEITEYRTGKNMKDCDHDYYQIKVCKKCGDKFKVYEDQEK